MLKTGSVDLNISNINRKMTEKGQIMDGTFEYKLNRDNGIPPHK
jgi:hypothetical protein